LELVASCERNEVIWHKTSITPEPESQNAKTVSDYLRESGTNSEPDDNDPYVDDPYADE
jgi:hypothetical protein